MRVLRLLCMGAILVSAWAWSAATALAAGDTTYVVAPGDTLASIAAANGSSVQALIVANGVSNPDLIWVGQKLIIPLGSAEPPTPRPNDPTPTSPPAGSERAPTHVVQPGQTLTQIARRFGVSLAVIVNANGIPDPDRIYSGTTLLIPGAVDSAGGAPDLQGTRFIASISEQRCWLYQDDALIGDWECSTGRGEAQTVPGSYTILSKINPAYASTWDFWMPYWMGIYFAGGLENGIHGLPYDPKTGRQTWAGLVGTPITYGCIMLDDVDANTLFNIAYVGMPVVILP